MDSIKTQLLKVETIKDNSILSINSLIHNINRVLDVLHSKDLNVPGNLFANGIVIMSTSLDPQDATADDRPRGLKGQLIYYNDKLYFCTDAATPTWEKITST